MNKRTIGSTGKAALLIFFYYAAVGSIAPIYNLLFQAKGFEMAVISYILMVPRVFYVFSGVIWASIADFFRIHRRLLSLAMLLTIPFMIGLRFSSGFLANIILFGLFAFCLTPLIPLTDNAVISILGDDHQKFGTIRFWGAISYGLSALMVGRLTDLFSINIAYWFYVGSILLCAWIAWRLPEQPQYKPIPFWRGVHLVIGEKRWIGFLFASVLMGFGQMLLLNYYSPFMKDIGATNSMIGLSITISTLSEIPIYLYSPRFMKKGTEKICIQVALFVMAVRSFSYAFIHDPEVILWLQLVNGLTYALFWIGAVIYVKNLAPEGFAATSQAFLAAAFFGLGGILGTLGAGQIYAAFGHQVMFIVCGVAGILGWVIFGFLSRNHVTKGPRKAV